MPRRGENIYKRKDGRYEGRYIIGRKENGKPRFGYVYGRQYSVVREALIKKKSERIDIRNGQCRRSILLASCMKCWLSELRGTVKQSSFQTYLSLAEKHILPTLGSLELNRISSSTILNFSDNLAASGLSCSTVRSVCRLVCSCLRYAQEEGYIAKNPCCKLRISVQQTDFQRVLTRSEQNLIQSEARDTFELPVLLAAYTGMRLGEICALKWSDIDWEKSTVCVCRTVQRIRNTGGGTMLIIDTPKSLRSRRVIPVPAFITDMLKRMYAEMRSEYIFGSSFGPAEPRTVQRHFHALLKKVGITGAHFHTLRHSFATRLIELGVDIKTVSTLLGHSSAKITLDFYAHSRLETQRSAVEKLANL